MLKSIIKSVYLELIALVWLSRAAEPDPPKWDDNPEVTNGAIVEEQLGNGIRRQDYRQKYSSSNSKDRTGYRLNREKDHALDGQQQNIDRANLDMIAAMKDHPGAENEKVSHVVAAAIDAHRVYGSSSVTNGPGIPLHHPGNQPLSVHPLVQQVESAAASQRGTNHEKCTSCAEPGVASE